MLQASWYLLKVVLCSGILLGYYWLMLRNKIYHHYNRFFLLVSAVLSLTLPLLTIHITHYADAPQSQAIQLLQAVNSDAFLGEMEATQSPAYFPLTQFLTVLYALVSIVMLVLFIRVLWVVRSLIYKYKGQIVERFYFISTNAKGTPFSFFNYIFWNEAIDIESHTGRQIFKHEVAHVQERHSYDKIFINCLLIVFWCNPFFWLIRKELNMIHEFIADKRAVEDNDTASFAAMILQAAYPRHRFELTNNFFYSPIKRRLLMLTKNQKPKVSYISRIMVLPLAALVFAAFTFKAKPIYAKLNTGNAPKQITVVLDAGHGGTDAGSYGINGEREKDLTLAIVQKIKSLNPSDNINFILTRDGDATLSPIERVNFSKAQKADLFISVHLDAAPKQRKDNPSGMSVWISRAGSNNTDASKLLASGIIGSFQNNYNLTVSSNPTQRQMGIWVLQGNDCPSVLIEAGYITNSKDAAYLQTEAGQTAFAQNIITAINNYRVQPAALTAAADTIPEKMVGQVKSATVTVKKVTATDSSFKPTPTSDVITVQADKIYFDGNGIGPDPLFVLNGTVTDKSIMNKLNTNDIKEVHVLKDANVIKKYGEKARNGVVEIITKDAGTSDANKSDKEAIKAAEAQEIDGNEPIFSKVEIDAQFPGGTNAWKMYLMNNLNTSIAVKEGWGKGFHTINVEFLVDKNGQISKVVALNKPNSKMAQHCVDIIKKGPNWKPATQNGRIVIAYRKQPITFVIE